MDQAVAAGWQVRALSRRPESIGGSPSVSVLQGSLSSRAALERLVDGVDAVVHCAGLIKARRSGAFDAVNAEGTANIVDIAAAQASPPRFLLMSSLAAREPGLSAYAGSKQRGEAALTTRGDGLDWQIIRPPAVYGPGDTATLSLFRQFKQGLTFVPRNRAARFSLLYVDDLARAVLVLLEGALPARQTLELHDGRRNGYSWDDIAEVARRVVGREIRWVRVPSPVMRGLAMGNVAFRTFAGKAPVLTPGKVREICHADWVCRNNLLDVRSPWYAKVDVQTGFRRTLDWYEAAGWL
jgi:nucleoside-diphosphate-sugar epimerase